MIRKIDELGRIVIPIEMRKQLRIAERDPLDIQIKGGKLVLSKVKDDPLVAVIGDAIDRLHTDMSPGEIRELRDALINASIFSV